MITNWDDMEKLWHYTLYNELKVNPEEHPIILTETALNPKQNREHITKIMFEKFNIPCLYVSMQEICALYASGRTTGVVIDSGEGKTHAVPIFEGFSVPNTIQKMELSGKDLTEYLRQLLREKGVVLQTPAEIDIIREIKESSCYVVSDYDQAI